MPLLISAAARRGAWRIIKQARADGRARTHAHTQRQKKKRKKQKQKQKAKARSERRKPGRRTPPALRRIQRAAPASGGGGPRKAPCSRAHAGAASPSAVHEWCQALHVMRPARGRQQEILYLARHHAGGSSARAAPPGHHRGPQPACRVSSSRADKSETCSVITDAAARGRARTRRK